MMNMRQAAKLADIPYTTIANWVQKGLIHVDGYKRKQHNAVQWTDKQTTELFNIVSMRTAGLSLQAIGKAAEYLRTFGHNPFSTGKFAVIDGPPNNRRLIKVTDHDGAVELLSKHKGQTVLAFVPLMAESLEPEAEEQPAQK